MTIDREQIKHLEELARIELSDEERLKLAAQLEQIVKFVEKLKEVDTSVLTAPRAASGLAPPHIRSDGLINGLPRERVLDQAPDTDGRFYLVPRVISRGEED